MKFNASFKYQLLDARKALITFWIIVLAVLILLSAVAGRGAEIRGMEMASAIFMFVVGLNSFKPVFYMSIANGVSRRTQFAAFLSAIFVIAVLMAIVDAVYRLIFSNILPYMPLFGQLYGAGAAQSAQGAVGAVWSVFLYGMVAMLGYMICLIYYRSNLPVKLAVSIAPPVLLFVVLPYAAMLYPASAMGLAALAGRAFGLYPSAAPFNAIVTFICCTALFGAASYLLMRRAELKK